MRSLSIGILSIFYSLFTTAQSQLNLTLKKELDSIFTQDQKFRELLSSQLLQTKADSLAASFSIPKNQLLDYLIKTMTVTDSSNLNRVVQIIKQYGYPGISLVGQGTNEATFFVIQHSTGIDQYLPVIKKAADEKELAFTLYAMMLDRSLMYNGKEQIYGTQGKGFEVLNPQTGKKEFVRIIWPIENVNEVNLRRKNAGFNDTVEENAKRLGIDYKILTLAEVKHMQGQ